MAENRKNQQFVNDRMMEIPPPTTAQDPRDPRNFNEQNLDQFNRDQELLRILTGGPAGTPPAPMTTNPLAAGLGAGLVTSQLFPQTSAAGPTQVQGGPGTFATSGFNPASTNPAFTFG